MNRNIEVRKTTIQSLEIIFAYQGKQLIRKIGKKKGWSEEEMEHLIKEFINTKNFRIEVVEDMTKPCKRRSVDVSPKERCIALTANKEQCSRRRKKDHTFCGIHLRKSNTEDGLEYGVVENVYQEEEMDKKKIMNFSDCGSSVEDRDLYPLGNMVDDSDDDDITVCDICINGVSYLIDYETNHLYSTKTEEYVGKYDKEHDNIILVDNI